MVIGKGLVGKGFMAFDKDNSIIIFASGVSNSTSTNKADFTREANLLNETLLQNKDKKIVYISTCSIYDSSLKMSAYVQHKLAMEKLVSQKSKQYYIFRFSNLAGATANPYTVLNFFYYHIIHRLSFQLWVNACRNIIDVVDAVSIATYFIKNNFYLNQVINVANPQSYPVSEIVTLIEKLTKKKGVYQIVNKGTRPTIDTTLSEKAINDLGLSFTENYLERILKKYLLQNDL